MRAERATFSLEFLLLLGIIMFAGQCGSRRQLGRDLAGSGLAASLWRMLGRRGQTAACHTDTLNRVLELLAPEALELLIAGLAATLHRQRMLRRFLCDGYLVVAMDGVMLMRVRQPPAGTGWLTTEKDDTISYSRYVLAATIVTAPGLVIPCACEFIENPDGPFDKQDCERKAGRRLLEKLRQLYPRTKILITADALYEDAGIIEQCEKLGFAFMICHKEKKVPTIERQLPTTDHGWTGERRVTVARRGAPWHADEQHVRWQHGVSYREQNLYVIDFTERDSAGEIRYYNQWITNLKPTRDNALALAKTGRSRWKIENEDFNSEKNGGYEMSHGYGQRGHAWKNYYLLLQIGKLFNDLVRLGNIIQTLADDPRSTFARLFGTMHHYARRLIQSLATATGDESPSLVARAWQYRVAPD